MALKFKWHYKLKTIPGKTLAGAKVAVKRTRGTSSPVLLEIYKMLPTELTFTCQIEIIVKFAIAHKAKSAVKLAV
jgi:hypothetical protein